MDRAGFPLSFDPGEEGFAASALGANPGPANRTTATIVNNDNICMMPVEFQKWRIRSVDVPGKVFGTYARSLVVKSR
jgi:hypothetical protein